MAGARDRNDNPYEDGGGFGKFRKRPFRKVHNTPYDRPPTAVRNPSLAAATANHSNGWLSKLVDPAQRLITSGAHKLFASVFRKRLTPPPPPQPPEPEENVGASNCEQEAVPRDSLGLQEPTVNEIDYPASSSDRGGLTELELILKQKTFTKSEIDRLTALLQSRTVDQPLSIQENSEVIPSKPLLPQERKDVPVTPVKDNRFERYDVATPIASSSVLDEDVATPAELAKAYMGSRPSKLSPPMLGMHSNAIEDSVAHINRPLPSKSPILSIVPRSSVRGTAVENGFVTPRSRGRSAIYNMARTPYSRLHSTSTLQGTGSEIDVLGVPSSSSSQSLRGNGKFSGFKQGALKKRSSVFDNDIGSVGPIRRIRQKSNLLPSSGTLSIHGTGIASESAKFPSSSQKLALTSAKKTDNGDNMACRSGTSCVPSKSIEMASQILQQLDMLVPTRDKSPTKLSPSMLRGQALRSLDNVESSTFLEIVQDNKKLDIRPGGSPPDTQKSVSQKEDKALGNGTTKPLASNGKSAFLLNGVDPVNLVKSKASDVNSTSPPGLNSVAQSSQKKRAFQMSAHEDFLELDDDDHTDKTSSVTLSTEKEKLGGAIADKKASSAEATMLEKNAAFSEGKSQSISMLNQNASESSNSLTVPDKNATLTVAAASLSGVSSQQAIVDNQAAVTSSNASPPKEPNADALSSFAKKAVSPTEPNGFATTFDFNSKASVVASTMPVVAGPKGTLCSDNKSDNSSSLNFYAFNATKSLPKEPESDNAVGRNNLKEPLFSSSETASSAVSTSSPSTSSLFSFTGMAANASFTNGSIPTPPVSSADTGLVSKTVTGQSSIGAVFGSNSISTTTTAGNSNGTSSLPISTSTPSFVSGSAFKFCSSTEPPVSTLSKSATTGIESAESEVKETSLGNPITSPFGSSVSPINSTGGSLFSGTSSALKNTGNSIFGGTSVTASSSNSFGISSAIATNGSSSIFSFNAGSNSPSDQSQIFSSVSAASSQASSAGTTFATASQSTPISFGTSASVPSFGFTVSMALRSGSALFNSSTSADKLFSSGASFGLTSSASAPNPVSSTTHSTLSSNFPTPNFGSAFSSSSSSSSSPFAFGASSTSGATAASTSTAPLLFGSSTNASSGSVFNFNSPVASTPSQPVFGSTPNSSFVFSSSPGNNDQMNMEDSMAEDTVQTTTSTAPVFGQQPVTPPSSSFVFGSTAPTGGNQFPSASSSGVNPFQFGGQPNLAAAQNQSPFQASGSLEFNAGGSFSLGTGDKSGRKFVRVSRKNQRKK